MADPVDPGDDLMRRARAYLARMSNAAPPDGLIDETVQQAMSRRARLSMVGLLGTGAVALATVGAVIVTLAFHAVPVAVGPAGPSRTPVTPGATTPAPAPATTTPSPSPAPVVPAASPTPTAVSVCQANPSPATAADVIVDQPAAFTQLTTPFVVSGRINAYEATFRIDVKDALGREIVAQMGHSQQGQTLSPFSERVSFAVTASTPACLWVFQDSARDGSPTKIAEVPVTLAP
jgi:hypothetical protein